MGRTQRVSAGNEVYHVLNRANGCDRIFQKDNDYEAFESILAEAREKYPIRILAYTLMPNHWHLLLYPYKDGDLSLFLRWLTLTHTQRWHSHYKSIGCGHLYQGRFKSFLVQKDDHFLTVVRYVERNPVRAQLISKAEDWRWGSAWRRKYGTYSYKRILSPWPVSIPNDYSDFLNATLPQEENSLESIRVSIKRGRPFGSDLWADRTLGKYGLKAIKVSGTFKNKENKST